MKRAIEVCPCDKQGVTIVFTATNNGAIWNLAS